ncbi:MAG: copper-binding protein [Hydrogenophilaceae bacterium]
MKRTLPALILALGLPLGLPVLADTDHSHDNAAGHAAMSNMLTEGTVKKVDQAQGKLTIRHGPLENLGMPAMTMIFRVNDPALLSRVKPGDNIRFQAEKVNGLFTVTRLEAAQ